MANKWIEFIKKWAKENNSTYGCALSNPKCKEDYKKSKEEPKQEDQEYQENEEDNKMKKYEKEKSIQRHYIDGYLKEKDYIGLLNNKAINFNDKKNILRNFASIKQLKELTFDELSEFVKFKNINLYDICYVYINDEWTYGYVIKKTAKTLTFEKIKLFDFDFIKIDEFIVNGRKDFGRNEYYYYMDKPGVDSSKLYNVRFKTDEEGLQVYNKPCLIRLRGKTHTTF